jgi:energy-converting hydrogenase Eha subunit B
MALARIKSVMNWADEVVIDHWLRRRKKELAPSGKSPAYIYRRNNRARTGKLAAGFFNSRALKDSA